MIEILFSIELQGKFLPMSKIKNHAILGAEIIYYYLEEKCLIMGADVSLMNLKRLRLS